MKGTDSRMVANSDLIVKAVAPLVEVMVDRASPVPVWTSLPPAGSTDRLLALRKSIPRIAIWISACRKVQLKSWWRKVKEGYTVERVRWRGDG